MTKLKRLLSYLRGFFPSKVPTGMTEFDSWAQSIIDTYNFPTNDRPTLIFGLSTTIMRLGPTEAYKAKYFFYKIICAGAAKQIASEQFRLVKEGQVASSTAAPVVTTPPPEAAAVRATRSGPTQ